MEHLKKIFNLAKLVPFEFDTTYLARMDGLFSCINQIGHQATTSSEQFEINSIQVEEEPVKYIPIASEMIGDYFGSNKVLDS